MIPIRDTVRWRYFPIINWILIAIHLVVFLYEIGLSPLLLNRLVHTFGLIPADFPLNRPLDWLTQPALLVTPFTNIFLHAGWFHFLSNMWVLHIFGDNVEDRMGPGRYILFYFASGLVANIAEVLINQGSQSPAIGASGAIAGVMAAYFLYHPRARIFTLVPIFFIPWFLEVPAFFFLGFWFLSQLYSGIFSLGLPSGEQMSSVAWWAHIGGFLFGLAASRLFASPERAIGTEHATMDSNDFMK